MIIKTFIEPPIENNNYLIIDEVAKEAALIDCSFNDEDIKLTLEKYGAVLKYILLTHGHFDHIAGLEPHPSLKILGIKHKYPSVLVHENDMGWIEEVNTYLPMVGLPSMEVPTITDFIKDGDVIEVGSLKIKVIHTPGHTQGGVCFYVDGVLFSGDTIFKEAVGRCDLPGGNFEQLVESIKNKIFTLPDETIIYPGHGQKTNVGWEKEHNQYL